MKARQNQFEIIIDYMEKNGDLCRLSHGTQARIENLRKWNELADILNKNLKREEPKPLQKWRKAWSDFKNNTRKKQEKIETLGEGPDLTEVEKRVLKMMGDEKARKRGSTHLNIGSSHIQLKEEIDTDGQRSNGSSPHLNEDSNSSPRKDSSASSTRSNTPSQKRRKLKEEYFYEIADRFLELEKEKEKMAHEREMARIKQNEQMLAVFGRIVNVLEALAPSIQRYLDRNSNEDG